MRELGEYLRQMRENRGVTLEEVASATKVNIRYLEALEEGQYDVLPPEVYVRGFLISYAEFLNIDPDELFGRMDAERPKRKKSFFAPREQKTITSRQSPVANDEDKTQFSPIELWHSIKAIPTIVYIIALAIIIIGTVIIISLGNEELPDTVSEVILGDTTIQHASPAPLDEDIAQQIRILIDSVNAAQALSIAESLTFVIRTRQPVNIYIELDHVKKAFKGMLYAGQRKEWRVKNSVYIETGNPSALRISVNGFELTPFQTRHPQTLEINRQNVLQFLEGYEPPPPGVSSAYGQRIETATSDTVHGPPSEARPPRRNKTSTQQDTSLKGKPKIKPPRTKNSSGENGE